MVAVEVMRLVVVWKHTKWMVVVVVVIIIKIVVVVVVVVVTMGSIREKDVRWQSCDRASEMGGEVVWYRCLLCTSGGGSSTDYKWKDSGKSQWKIRSF